MASSANANANANANSNANGGSINVNNGNGNTTTRNVSKRKTKTNNKKTKSKGSSRISLVISVVILGVVAVEYVAYTSLLPMPEDMNSISSSMGSGMGSERKTAWADDTSSSSSSSQLYNINRKSQDLTSKLNSVEIDQERLKTVTRLRHMDVEEDYELEELPPWSQILDNFHPQTRDDEPIILGLEHCPAFRKKHKKRQIGIGPAGMFSTGTNLIAYLLSVNCKGPLGRVGRGSKFALVQVPWGKHNPADARFQHQVKMPIVKNREAILPVVAIRHPYTWMLAMCKHSYNTQWHHERGKCHLTPHLENPIRKVPYGFHAYNETHNVTNTYNSLAEMWMEWYKPYFLEQQYNQTPRIMVRHEDMVYRPEKVVSKLCECVGGTNNNNITKDWEAPGGFQYMEKGANMGRGHGVERSGLLTAVIKYGQPLRNWYDMYNGIDRKIMKARFQGEKDPHFRNVFDTFQYRLYNDVAGPTNREKMLTLKRVIMEEQQLEKRAETNPEIQVQLEKKKERNIAIAELKAKKAKKAQRGKLKQKFNRALEQQQRAGNVQKINAIEAQQRKTGKAQKKNVIEVQQEKTGKAQKKNGVEQVLPESLGKEQQKQNEQRKQQQQQKQKQQLEQ